jgi:acyl-CoA synthetase (AMP-forming)/AMP-acid ligase II
MKSDDALLIAWNETLANKRDTTAIFEASGNVSNTFSGIETQARYFERQMAKFDSGSVIAIQIGNDPDWPALLLACLRRKLVALPLEQSIAEVERDAALTICRARALITGSAATLTLRKSWSLLPVDTARCARASVYQIANRPSPDWGGKPPSLLKLTSGTSAAPRAVRFRSAQLLADCDQICETMGISDVDLNFGVIPISHSYGFSNLLTPLIAHGVPIVLSRDRLPRAVLLDLARTNATVFPGTPVFYQALCEMENVPALPKLRLCISAGAPLSGATAKGFLDKFARPIHSFYGSSECGGICYDRDGEVFEDGFVGEPMKDVDLTMVNPTMEVSQVRVRSAAVGDGYYPNPDETRLGGGFFMPDDLLMRRGEKFKVVGRVSDVINIAGKKINPALIEAQLLRFAGVREAVAFGRKSSQRNEEVAACVVADVDVRENDLLEFCRQELSPWQVPKQIFIVDTMPTNERGKISRRELAQRFGKQDR